MSAQDTPLQRALESVYACEAGREWVGDRCLELAWRECPNPYWIDYVILKFAPIDDEHYWNARLLAIHEQCWPKWLLWGWPRYWSFRRLLRRSFRQPPKHVLEFVLSYADGETR